METIKVNGKTYEKVEGVEVTLSNGVKVIRHEHPEFKVVQADTGYLFDCADDVLSNPLEYGVTDVPKLGNLTIEGGAK